jgi:hypothetical protein
MALDVVVVGKANVDYIARAPRLPGPGEGVNGDAFQQAAGGKGANQAVGAARLLGAGRVALIARVGTDAGPAILKNYRPGRILLRLLVRLVSLVPPLRYQFVFVLRRP